ncbi:MAG: DUF523 and DUF1722 domain-containing protein [Peptostreptococcaceae bacterium]
MRKPKLIISRCLNSEKCRYDGQGFDDKVIRNLKEYIDIETICPEVEIGLNTPRDPIRIEKHGKEYKLIQHNSNNDYTNHMTEFAEEFVGEMKDIDGFIFKSKSPSCGMKDVKIYPKGNKCSISKDGTGFFTKKILDSYTNVPIENEGRLKNYVIRDEFLTKIFTINNLKFTEDIIEFHKNNNLLLKSYDEKQITKLESIINKDIIDEKDTREYKNIAQELLNLKRNKNNKLNIINSIFQKYEDKLSKNEIKHHKELLEMYKNQKTPYSSLLIAIKMYAIRFEDKEILSQTFFNPYPIDLMNITDSGKGRDL